MSSDMVNQVLATFFNFLRHLIEFVQPALVPICFVAAWGLLLLLAWSMWSAVRDGVSRAKRMHKIPCADCQYFTGDYHLKCPVRPTIALSEAAINCPDFEPVEASRLPAYCDR
ncbi:MAG: hypothetical protein VKK04_27005 [Synechococcales bacterium]|nr:hypothetical protein [Synechococcales bacterium]